MAYELPRPLPYDYAALEPFIDAETMKLHHDKHHQAYINNVNAALEKYPDLAAKSVDDLIRDFNAVPEEIRGVVRRAPGLRLRVDPPARIARTPSGVALGGTHVRRRPTASAAQVETSREQEQRKDGEDDDSGNRHGDPPCGGRRRLVAGQDCRVCPLSQTCLPR